MYSHYYQAQVKKETAWLMTGIIRSFEHLMFDRTIDKENSIFEFFVSPGLEDYFLEIMSYLEKRGFVSNIQKLPNRFEQ